MQTDAGGADSTLFVGLGKMGDPMVRRYAANHETTVYDVSRDAVTRVSEHLGVRALASLSELPGGINVVILMLPNSAIVESVLVGDADSRGILGQLPPGSLVIDMGSSRPASTVALANRARELGIDYADAPVSGGTAKAESGQLSIMIGGAGDVRKRAAGLVDCLAADIVEVGGPGTGHAAKALNNWLSAANLAAAAETLCIAEQCGIDPAIMVQTLNASTGRSQATEVKYPNHILTGTYSSGFAFDLMYKDLNIAKGLGHDHNTFTPILASVRATVESTREHFGRDDLDHTEVARYYAERNGVSLRGGFAEGV